MARFWVILAVVAVAFVIYSLVDCAMTDRARIRGPRKGVWILLILLLPVIGALLWFFIGRGRAGTGRRPATRVIAPDDDPAFLARLRQDADREERLRRLEEELMREDASEPDTEPTDETPDKRRGDESTDGTGAAGRRDV